MTVYLSGLNFDITTSMCPADDGLPRDVEVSRIYSAVAASDARVANQEV